MILKAKFLGLEAGGKPIVVLNKDDAEELGLKSLSRVYLRANKKELIAILNTSKFLAKGIVGVYEEVVGGLQIKEGSEVDVEVARYPNSLNFIKNKLKKVKLSYDEIHEIVRDTVQGRLTDVELTAFVTALHETGLDLDEATNLTLAMVETGRKLGLSKDIILDKHSIGGIPGDKTTLLLVPIIAAAGFTIPKTSSRAITSAAGTADRAEVLMNVEFDMEEMKRIVNKTNGCIVWGGALHLAPADDIFIQIEYPLSIDPLMLPSIMSKKKAVGATHLVVDIPTGRGTKIKTIGDADLLAKEFIELGKRLQIKIQCAVTYGEQPLGYTIGPALEAREALEVITNKNKVPDLIDKVVHLSGILFRLAGKSNGEQLAREILQSGKAEQKLREIIFEQNGDSEIRPEEIGVGDFGFDVTSDKSGLVLWLNNQVLVEVARAAGAPKDKGAGILLYKKVGDKVKANEKVFTIFAEKSHKLNRASKLLEEEQSFAVGERMEMLIHEVKEMHVAKKSFILER